MPDKNEKPPVREDPPSRARHQGTNQPRRPPAEGERRAVGGYSNQYKLAAQLILDALGHDLEWIRVADPEAGRVDDIQISSPARLDAYQVKWNRAPRPLTWGNLLEPSNVSPGLLRQLADGWAQLRTIHPNRRVIVHLLTTDLPSPTAPEHGSLERFLHEAWPSRDGGRSAIREVWLRAWDACVVASGLDAQTFDEFARSCEIEPGYSLVRSPFSRDGEGLPLEVDDIAGLLWRLVADPAHIVEVSRAELLEHLGWTHHYQARNHHDFPVDLRVYRAPAVARAELDRLLDSGSHGYAAVVGPPGSGKSSLLTEALRLRQERVIKYYAFVPGESAGATRGEAISFLHDLVVAIRRAGFGSKRPFRDERQWLHEELASQLEALGSDYTDQGQRTIVLVDGLDHTVREPLPERPLVGELPESGLVPPGVLILLGTQTTELEPIPASIRVQVLEAARRIELGSLDRQAVDGVIDAWQVEPPLSDADKDQIRELANGHPLALTYALRRAAEAQTAPDRAHRLATVPLYEGDLRAYYEAHWTGLHGDEQVRDALLLAARLRGPIDVPWLMRQLDAPGVGWRLEDRAGHLFRRPSTDRWTFFHDSFRQYLVERTARDDQAIHRRIAGWLAADPASAELLYHRVKAGDDQGALELAEFSYFREQFFRRRPPEEIVSDIQLLESVAARLRDTERLVRLMLIAAEIDQRGYVIDRRALIDSLARVGETEAARAYAEQPVPLGNRDRVRLDGSLALARAGSYEEARRLLDAEGPDLAREPGAFAREAADEIDTWGRASARLLPEAAIDEIRSVLRQSDETTGLARAGSFTLAAVEELIDIGEFGYARRMAGQLDVAVDRERGDRARAWVALMRSHRALGNTTPQEELAEEAWADFHGTALPIDTVYRLIFEIAAARRIGDASAVSRMRPPGAIDQSGLEGFQRYRPFMWWIALRVGVGLQPDFEVESAALGERADLRVARVAHGLGRLLGLGIGPGLDVWTFRDIALEIVRAFVLRPDAGPLDDYPLGQSRVAAYDNLIAAAVALGQDHVDALLGLFEAEWATPRMGWPDDLKRRILRSFLRLGGFDGRVRPHLEAINEPAPGGDVGSRFVEWLDRADSWQAIGDQARATGAIDRALETSFGVGYRKDYQLEHWLDWLGRVNRVDAVGAPGRIARLASGLKGLDDATEGRATELASTALVGIAADWNPGAAGRLLQWLLADGAVTFHGGSVALLRKAIDANTNPNVVAALAGAWTIPFEREADVSFARALCGALQDANAVEGTSAILNALQHYSRPGIRPAWAHVLHEKFPDGVLAAPEAIGRLLTTGLQGRAAAADNEPSSADAAPLDDLDGLEAWLGASEYVSGDQIRRVATPLISRLPNADLAELPDRLPQAPSTLLCVAAAELRERGDGHAALIVAESALNRRRPGGWDRWYDGGTVLDTVALLRQIDPARGRELAYEALREDLSGGSVDSATVLRSLDELLPNLTDLDLSTAVWGSLDAYLTTLLDLDRPRPRPDFDDLPGASFDIALARLAAERLFHPVKLIAQLTREAIASLVTGGWVAGPDELVRLLGSDDPEEVLGALSVLEVVALEMPARVEAFRAHVEPHRASASLDIRFAAARVLADPYDALRRMAPPGEMPPIYRVSLPPSTARIRGARMIPEDGQPLRTTDDPAEVVGAFVDEIRLLAKVTGLSTATLAHRLVEIVRDLGRGAVLDYSAERTVMDNLEAVALVYPYVRPRSTALRVAIGRLAAELLDYGQIDVPTARLLEDNLRWTDPRLDVVVLGRAPSWLIRPIRPRETYEPLEPWVNEVQSLERPLPQTDHGFVIAESSLVRRLEWERPTERRFRTLVGSDDAGAVAMGLMGIFGSTYVPINGHAFAGRGDDPLVLRCYGLRFESTKDAWLTINASAATTMDWRPVDGELGTWIGPDGGPRVRSTVWMDGYADAPSPELDDEPAHGTYLEATTTALTDLETLLGPLLVFERVEREARDRGARMNAESSAFWDWRRYA